MTQCDAIKEISVWSWVVQNGVTWVILESAQQARMTVLKRESFYENRNWRDNRLRETVVEK